MTFMFILYVYNAVSIPLRASFPLTQGTNFIPIGTLRGPPELQWVGLLVMWILLDLLADVLYVLDIIFVQSHLTPQELGENDHNQVSVVRTYPGTYSIYNYVPNHFPKYLFLTLINVNINFYWIIILL